MKLQHLSNRVSSAEMCLIMSKNWAQDGVRTVGASGNWTLGRNKQTGLTARVSGPAARHWWTVNPDVTCCGTDERRQLVVMAHLLNCYTHFKSLWIAASAGWQCTNKESVLQVETWTWSSSQNVAVVPERCVLRRARQEQLPERIHVLVFWNIWELF